MARRAMVALCSAAFAGVAAAPAVGAPTITEYATGLSGNAAPVGIAAASDGNLWFTETGGASVLGRVSTAGTISSFSGALEGTPLYLTTGPDGKLWFTESGAAQIGTVDPLTHTLNEYPVPGGASAAGITSGPEGDVWFAESAAAMIGRIAPSTHVVTRFAVPTKASQPYGIAVGPEEDLWFTEYADPGGIGRLDPRTKVITEFSAGLTVDSEPTGMTRGPEGDIWFTEAVGRIGRVDPATGTITEFSSGLTFGAPLAIAAGSDGNLYFTETGGSGAVGQITPSGVIHQFTTGLTPNSRPWGITSGPDGNMWFVENANPAKVARLTVAPSVSGEAAEAVLTQTATLTAEVGANAQSTTYRFQYGPTAAYGTETAGASAGAGPSPGRVSASLEGLSPGRPYHFRALATNPSGTTQGPDATFTTPPAATVSGEGGSTAAQPAPLPGSHTLLSESGLPTLGSALAKPVIGRSAAVEPVSGVVLVEGPHGTFVPLTGAATVPIGSTLDTTNGVLRLITATGGGRTQAATVWGGVLAVSQSSHGSGMTILTPRPVGGASCPRPGRARASSARSRTRKSTLWARDSHGQYSTHGANSVATVLGTEWETVETCAGTLTRVVRGRVRLRDLHRRVTIVLSAGHSYLARR